MNRKKTKRKIFVDRIFSFHFAISFILIHRHIDFTSFIACTLKQCLFMWEFPRSISLNCCQSVNFICLFTPSNEKREIFPSDCAFTLHAFEMGYKYKWPQSHSLLTLCMTQLLDLLKNVSEPTDDCWNEIIINIIESHVWRAKHLVFVFLFGQA